MFSRKYTFNTTKISKALREKTTKQMEQEQHYAVKQFYFELSHQTLSIKSVLNRLITLVLSAQQDILHEIKSF